MRKHPDEVRIRHCGRRPGSLAVWERHLVPGLMEAAGGRRPPCAWEMRSRRGRSRRFRGVKSASEGGASSVEMGDGFWRRNSTGGRCGDGSRRAGFGGDREVRFKDFGEACAGLRESDFSRPCEAALRQSPRTTTWPCARAGRPGGMHDWQRLLKGLQSMLGQLDLYLTTFSAVKSPLRRSAACLRQWVPVPKQVASPARADSPTGGHSVT